MTTEEKLKKLIDAACVEMDMPSSEELAKYLVRHGVTVLYMPVEVGTPVYRIKTKEKRASGTYAHCYVYSEGHFESVKNRGGEFYVAEKPFVKSEASYIGSWVFLTREEAEKALEKINAPKGEGEER